MLKVVPEDLLPLYDREELCIVCTLGGDFPREMSFRKYKGSLWARNNDEEMHKVSTLLKQPEDFIAYTLQYYGVTSN